VFDRVHQNAVPGSKSVIYNCVVIMAASSDKNITH